MKKFFDCFYWKCWLPVPSKALRVSLISAVPSHFYRTNGTREGIVFKLMFLKNDCIFGTLFSHSFFSTDSMSFSLWSSAFSRIFQSGQDRSMIPRVWRRIKPSLGFISFMLCPLFSSPFIIWRLQDFGKRFSAASINFSGSDKSSMVSQSRIH